MFDTPEYGPVAFVVIGATMVSCFVCLTALYDSSCLSNGSVYMQSDSVLTEP